MTILNLCNPPYTEGHSRALPIAKIVEAVEAVFPPPEGRKSLGDNSGVVVPPPPAVAALRERATTQLRIVQSMSGKGDMGKDTLDLDIAMDVILRAWMTGRREAEAAIAEMYEV